MSKLGANCEKQPKQGHSRGVELGVIVAPGHHFDDDVGDEHREGEHDLSWRPSARAAWPSKFYVSSSSLAAQTRVEAVASTPVRDHCDLLFIDGVAEARHALEMIINNARQRGRA